jgi:hypothetical protein
VAERHAPDPQPALSTPPPPLGTTTPTLPPEILRELQTRAAWRRGVLGALNVATAILAVRLILLLGVVGAVVLTVLALPAAQPMHLAALAIYVLGVVVPLVWLAGKP